MSHENKEVVSFAQMNQLGDSIKFGCECIIQSDGLAEHISNGDNVSKEKSNNVLLFLWQELQLSQGDTFHSLTEIKCKERLHCAKITFSLLRMLDS